MLSLPSSFFLIWLHYCSNTGPEALITWHVIRMHLQLNYVWWFFFFSTFYLQCAPSHPEPHNHRLFIQGMFTWANPQGDGGTILEDFQRSWTLPRWKRGKRGSQGGNPISKIGASSIEEEEGAGSKGGKGCGTGSCADRGRTRARRGEQEKIDVEEEDGGSCARLLV